MIHFGNRPRTDAEQNGGLMCLEPVQEADGGGRADEPHFLRPDTTESKTAIKTGSLIYAPALKNNGRLVMRVSHIHCSFSAFVFRTGIGVSSPLRRSKRHNNVNNNGLVLICKRAITLDTFPCKVFCLIRPIFYCYWNVRLIWLWDE